MTTEIRVLSLKSVLVSGFLFTLPQSLTFQLTNYEERMRNGDSHPAQLQRRHFVSLGTSVGICAQTTAAWEQGTEDSRHKEYGPLQRS